MNVLDFLAHPTFVIAWYAFGIVAALWVVHDLRTVNTALKSAMKWAWPIIVLFFSVFGIALYFATARPPGIAEASSDEERKKLLGEYERSMVRRVNGAVIHCVAGDGLGIMTAMVIARLLEMTFWQEFWFEYAVGFAFGWFIFQLKSMRMMTDSIGRALWMAFRAEFFSMLTVMGGMGAVMTYVTPSLVGIQPKPDTAAFWGFGMLGLLVGYVFTFPMNWMIVKIGWKHGMGPPEGAWPVHSTGAKAGLGFAMAALGVVALAIPAWLTLQRERNESAHLASIAQAGATASPDLRSAMQLDLSAAARALRDGDRRLGVAAMDGALRIAQVGRAANAKGAQDELSRVKAARRALQNARPSEAVTLLAQPAVLQGVTAQNSRARHQGYEGVPVLNAVGAKIGVVAGDDAQGRARLDLGGAHDVLGFWDGKPRQELSTGDLIYGPKRMIGKSFVMLPTYEVPPVAQLAQNGR